MKIAIDISQVVFEGTGTGNYTRNLVKHLLRINNVSKNHSFILFGTSLRKKNLLDDFAFELRKEGLNFKTSFWLLPPTFTSTVWNQIHHMKVERLIGKIDLFHSSDWTQPPTKAKKVTTIHDLIVYKYPEASPKEIVENQKKKLDWVKKECDAVIAVSKATQKDIEKILTIPPEKISVIYEGVEEEFKNVTPKKSTSKKYVLAMGGIGNRKNTDRVIEAFKELKRKDLDLSIIGQNLGFIPQSELPSLYKTAEVFVYPSLYEGFGLPVLEAMTAGCPVITSDTGSLPEVGGQAAFYVNPENTHEITSKLREVLALTKNDRGKVLTLGHKQAAKFSWEKAAKETLKLYEELV